MSDENISGKAYICSLNNPDDFIGRIFTTEGKQYCIQGQSHICNHDHVESEEDDHHACCFDETSRIISLEVSNIEDQSDTFTLKHVMKTGGDNFSLSSKMVDYCTDQILVGQKADSFILNFFSKEFVGHDRTVCIGHISINYPREKDLIS